MQFCAVCGSSLASTEWFRHFGADKICPSCAIFFARSMGKKLRCERPEGCVLFKKVVLLAGTPMHQFARTACRACRLQKCKRIGMREHFARKQPNRRAHKSNFTVEISDFAEKGCVSDDDEQQIVVLPSMNLGDENCLVMDQPFSTAFCDANRAISTLAFSDAKVRRIFGPEQMFKDGFLEGFSSVADLYQCTSLHKFVERNPWDPLHYFQHILAHGAFAAQPYRLIMDLVANIELFRAMPVSARMGIEDRVRLLSYVSMPLAMLGFNYTSAKCRSDTICYPTSGYSSLAVFRNAPIYAGDNAIQRLAEFLMHRTMEPFNRMQLTEEEFLLLRAIIFCNPAASGLSPSAQYALRAEQAHYAHALFLVMQASHPRVHAVARFAEVLRLAECAIRWGARYSQLLTYMAMVPDQGRFHARVPHALVPLCMQQCE